MIRAALIGCALVHSCAALAQSDDTAALRREVQALKARISEIERRLGEPASAPSVQPAPAPAAVPASGYPTAWLRVAQGMTQAEIRNLLGEPTKAFDLDGSRVWYYTYHAGAAGSVFFDSVGRASSFQRPTALRIW